MMTASTRRKAVGLAAALVMCGVGASAAPAGAAAAKPAHAQDGMGHQFAAGPGELTDHATDSVPPAIEVPPGQRLVGDFLGRGVQVYRCTAGAWVFVEPAANLVGWVTRPGNYATTVHFRGPSWESTDDGSLVEARVVAASPVAGSIPELLLQSTVTRGDGVFGNVSYVQRLATRGGVAPAGACREGQTTGVRYQAQYRFFTPAK